ncbi:MAG: hypothetical protein LBU58_08185, partial [Clostridiales bacterium]|nr:hypothetical protein [Clostridiales bacterium]
MTELLRTAGAGDEGRNLGQFLKTEFSVSARLLKQLKTNSLISVNGEPARTNYALRAGDVVRVALFELAQPPLGITP